jgi:Uma2 family endonuclease
MIEHKMTAAEAAKATKVAPEAWPLTVQAYRTLGEMGLIPDNTELLYGQIFQKMSKSPLHSFLHQWLIDALQSHLPPGTYLRVEQPVTCRDSEPEPDLAVVRGGKRDYRQEHPHTAELVIEVCVSSHDYDRSKLRAYAGAGVKEVWLVLAPEKQIEVHRQPMGEQFRQRILHGPGGRLASVAVAGFEIDLDDMFAG